MLGVEVNQPTRDGTQNDRLPSDPILFAQDTPMSGAPVAAPPGVDKPFGRDNVDGGHTL
jgi:hypothetical protein